MATATGMAEREPMLLLDTTGSMNHGTAADDNTPRRDTVREAIALLVARLAKEDSQAANEQGEDSEGGGLRAVTFAGGHAHDIGDLNPDNLNEKWKKIKWEGNTKIVPGWKKLMKVYKDEFGKRPKDEQPDLLALVITDGEAVDEAEFETTLKALGPNVFVLLAIIGFGADHDKTMASYDRLAKASTQIKVQSFNAETDPAKIAEALIKFVE